MVAVDRRLGAVLALSGAYAWYALRRRRRVEKFEDSLIAAEGVTSHSLFGTTGGEQVDTSQSTFATSTNLSGIDTHASEVDPIAEAEVYIAYGRDAQAEEILREALRRQPERQAVASILHEIGIARAVAAHYRDAAGQRLGDHNRRVLIPDGWHHQRIHRYATRIAHQQGIHVHRFDAITMLKNQRLQCQQRLQHTIQR